VNGALRFRCLPFAELDAAALYAVLRLRSAVFVVEQACVFLEMDDRDAEALHLLGDVAAEAGGRRLVAYARLYAPGAYYAEAAIGRVVTAPDVRGTGAGRTLMRRAIAECAARWPASPIRIGAQRYLERFYGSLGFVVDGAPYLEDGIPHIEMRRPADAS
jgi:ElaA protein